MAYNDEALKAKLSTLSETQDSIVSVSQWISFHKRHADRIASYWLTRLRDAPPPKRLNFIYLVNDIVQNARARKRAEFPDAFSPLMPEALATAYRSSTPDVQNKIRRVVEVWRTRAVFEVPIQSAIEARLDDIDKTKSSSGKKTLGGSLFGASTSSNTGTAIPTELSTLPPLQIAVTRTALAVGPTTTSAQGEYAKLNDPGAVLPSPPVHAARLSSLMKSLATAESNLNASIQARKALVADLERILSINKTTLTKDEAMLADFVLQKSETELKKRDVEDAIMRGFAASGDEQVGDNSENNNRGFRPEVEELTPEPDDLDFAATRPVDEYRPHSGAAQSVAQGRGHPQLQGLLARFGSTDSDDYHRAETSNPPLPGTISSHTPTQQSRVRQASSEAGLNGYGAKRRKISHGDSSGLVPDLGEMGMDENEFNTTPNEGSRRTTTVVSAAGQNIIPGTDLGNDLNTNGNGHDMLESLDADVDELIRGGSGDF